MSPDFTIELTPTLSCVTLTALRARLEQAAEARVVLLRGTPEVFCRGLELSRAEPDPGAAMAHYVEVLRALRRFPRPTLAVVEGPAIGGGLGLLAACDAVLATPGATFGLPEALYGFVPATVFPVLLERITPQKARLLAIDGLARDARWACDQGLADELVAAEQLEAVVRAWVRRLGRPHPAAIRALREVAALALDATPDDAIAHGAARTAAMLADPTVAARLRSFADDGVAPWGTA